MTNSPGENHNSRSASGLCTVRVIVEVVAGPHMGATYEFERHETLVVGRASAAQLCLDRDHYFSRHHFCLEVNPPDCLFRDLGSRNGTYINGHRCSEKILCDGDVISGGKTKLKIKVESAGSGNMAASPYVTTWQPQLPDGATAERSAAEKFPFQPVPGYEVLEEIGKGGMGVVYRARQLSSTKQVALKVILPTHAVSEDAMRFFIREASILGQLDHSHIVGFHEFGLAAGQLFLAMEYIRTIDLQQILRSQSKSSCIRIHCAIACQVLEALEYAHARSLVHRDIKPSNFLIYQPRKKLRVKLADFGLAKNYMNAGFSGMTLQGDIRGTLRYIPPEQVVDSRYAKPASDIYSVGATLYEFLCGKPLFISASGREQINAILEAKPPPLRERNPDVPAELAAIVDRALAKDPLDRFSSVEEMRQALLPFSKRGQN